MSDSQRAFITFLCSATIVAGCSDLAAPPRAPEAQFSGTSVKFLGILWGGEPGVYFNFSSYGLIREDFRSVRTF